MLINKVMYYSVTAACILTVSSALADVLVLKDGQSLTGTLISKSAYNIVFEIAGQRLNFDADKVKNISFSDTAVNTASAKTSAKTTSVSTAPSAVAATPSNSKGVAAIGSRVVVRTTSAINSREHKAGYKFTVKLEADLVSGQVIIAPRGTTIYGVITQAKKSGRLLGKSSLQLSMTDIMINNQLKPIQTSEIKAITEGTGKNTVSKTARYAAIGGLANGSTGAKNMAKAGVGVSLLTRGNSINISAGTLLEFQLAEPLAN
jgi:hypothetical protein